MSITGLMRSLSLIGINAIWQLSLGCLLMRTIASLLSYTGYLNFINGPMSRVLLLILVHVQLLSCLFFWFLASLQGSLYLACNDKNAFCTSEQPKRNKLWSCQKMCDALHYLLDNIFIRFGSKLYRHIVGIPMGTNCAPLVVSVRQ